MAYRNSRRDFMKTSALAGLGVIVAVESEAWAQDQSPNEKINFACIGVGGKGDSDTADAAKHGNVVAICDIDDNTLNKAGQRYPNAKKYSDFRKMLEEMENSIDAVTVSTADHTHAVASAMAMKMGKHCFAQKPLSHSIWEARRMGEIARKRKVATQMGNQGTSTDGLRESAALLKAGALGKVSEVHVWTNRPIWPQGGSTLEPSEPPPHVHWDLFLGPKPSRPYAKGYHPFAWRGFWDFGTGALGDMACHIMNMPFAGLDLRDPTSVVAETSGHNRDSYPKWSIITYEFPANATRGPLKLVWYDGGKLPPAELFEGRKVSPGGSLIIGEKGKLFTSNDYGAGGVLIGDITPPNVQIVKSPGHFTEFARAIKGGEPAMSNFPDYAGPLTETVLLGNLAVWADGKKIEWDADDLRPSAAVKSLYTSPVEVGNRGFYSATAGRPAPRVETAREVRHIVKGEYRKGWDLI